MSMPEKPIPFGEWLPDLPAVENPGALEAQNCIAHKRSYGPLRGLSAFTDAMDSAALGAFWMQATNNNVVNFAGNATKLYHLTVNNTVWADISIAGGYTAAGNWEFEKFGDRVIAVDIGHAPQYFDVGTSTLFANLPGSPPKAKWIAVVRDFIVLGDLENEPNTIQWGGYNSSELWTPSRATQADKQELFGRAGRVQRIVPGDYGVIIQEHSMRRMDYTGPPTIFRIDEKEVGKGTPSPNSVCWFGAYVFYYGHDGFYVFDGQESKPIGVDRVDKWFRANAADASLATMRGVIDRHSGLVMWSFSTSGSSVLHDRIIIYNWRSDRWSYASVDTEIISDYVTSGYTLDELDAVFTAGIDSALQTPFDSDAFKGGSVNLQAFDSTHKAATFNGAWLTAVLDTKETVGAGGRSQMLRNTRPVVDGDSSTALSVQVGHRKKANDAVTFTLPRAVNSFGEANIRQNSRYQRYRCTIAGGFTDASGVLVDKRESAGGR